MTKTDEQAILERRDALLRNLRRGVVALTGAVATACACLSAKYEPFSCPDAGDAGDGGTSCGTVDADGGPSDAGNNERG